MTNQEKTQLFEDSKLIGLFMDIPWDEECQWFILRNEETDSMGTCLHELQYYTSFEWIVPVLQKIALLGFFVEIIYSPGYNVCRIWRANDKVIFPIVISEDSLFKAAVAFIKQYNNTRKNEANA